MSSNDFKLFDIEGAFLADRLDESDLTYAFYILLDDPEVRELLRDFPAIISAEEPVVDGEYWKEEHDPQYTNPRRR